MILGVESGDRCLIFGWGDRDITGKHKPDNILICSIIKLKLVILI